MSVSVVVTAGPELSADVHSPSGDVDDAVDFLQGTSAAMWGPIHHGFGRLAVVVAVSDAAGNKRTPQVVAVDPDNIVLYFNDLVAGSARLL